MRTPEEIQADIDKLQEELIEASKWVLFCGGYSDDRIGFFDIGNTKKILKALYNGAILRYRHSNMGIVDVWMNPQRNRFCVTENPYNLEKDILDHIILNLGEWYEKKG